MNTAILQAVTVPIRLDQASPEVVKEVQRCLRIKVDGICGQQTMTAFYNFKIARSLGQLDWLGETTIAHLLAYSQQLISKQQAEVIFNKQITSAQLSDLNSCLFRFNISTPQRLRHFMSQVAHESGGLTWLKEIATGQAYEGRRDLGNNQPGDGRRYKGGGCLQVTGRANYQALCNYLNDPRVMEGANYIAEVLPFTSAGHWWMKNNMNPLCDSGATVEQVTKRVNGGSNGLSDRKLYYAIALRVIQ